MNILSTWFIKRYLPAAICILAGAGFLCSQDTIPLKLADGDDLSGLWECHGTEMGNDGDPKPYTSIVYVQKHGQGYLCQWTVGPGSNTLAIATRENDVLAVAWVSGGKPGISQFKIDKGGKSMSGKWMSFPALTWNSESLKYLGPLPKVKKVDPA